MPAPSSAEIRLLLSYPDVYEVGMSHLGLRLLYELVNQTGWASAERAFAFWPDMEKLSRGAGLKLYSLETFTPAAEFDVWGFSLQAELTYTNVLNMLDLAGLPLHSRDRDLSRHPLVLGGGAGAYNPEPLADFFDLFLVGDGEESLIELLEALRARKEERKTAAKEEFLAGLVREVKGLYAPSLYRPHYDGLGKFKELVPALSDLPVKIRKRTLKDLNFSRLRRPLVPLTEIIHDRDVVEIMRGCPRSCRFCQAGWTSRPVREKDVETVIAQALELNRQSGHREISLLSLSSGDYRRVGELLDTLSRRLEPDRVNISLPSLNINSVDPALLTSVRRVRKSGITLAPEAASPRLRELINKPMEIGAMESIAREARSRGWRLLKLYFMIGLPTEGEEDVLAVAEAVNRLSRWGGELNVTISNFVPKVGTPLQWAGLARPEELAAKQLLIKRSVRGGKVKLKFRSPFLSLIEALLARGDRRAGRLIEEAWRGGCRFDDWRESFQPRAWEDAIARSGLDLESAFRFPYSAGETLPWGHIDSGVSASILAREWENALEAGRGGPREAGKECRER